MHTKVPPNRQARTFVHTKVPQTYQKVPLMSTKVRAMAIYPTRTIDDSDDEEDISSSSSLSGVDAVKKAMELQRRLFPNARPNLKHLDKILLTSTVIVADALGERT